ncbi:trafficking protein particle complex subunit 11 isoform X2 [Agrilus planipennis]|nr:trafficking protein particle complex subunit 11 isoform X2 [Agrilus planipennis]
MEAKHVENHKEYLNKNTHQYLFVRHQFKMGFLNELKQDIHTAHKHYTYAYNKLLEIRIVDTNAMEIQTVAGFINYKLCKLMFTLNLPRDAISQFKAHAERFKSRIGFKELAFEHYAWLCKQYSIFGDIFDEAVRLGLPAVQTQHPGVYYQQAAQYAIQRKKSCLELCNNVTAYPTAPDPLEGLDHLEFYGQRPWRPGKLNMDNPDPQLEKKGIQALQFLEKQVAHSNVIISLYGLAVSQYKTYKCPRTRRYLVVQMAEEYFEFRDYGKALTLFTHMIWDYRLECWWSILSHILQKALQCAFLTATVQDYVTISLELLGKSITTTTEYKAQVYENLIRVLKKQIPNPVLNLPSYDVHTSLNLWKKVFESESIHLTVDMNSVVSCIETKARFLKDKYEADQNVVLEVFIRSTCPFLLRFTRLSVTINTSEYSSEFAVNETKFNNPNLTFESNEVKKFIVEFLPDSETTGKDMQINSINLYLGIPKECCVELSFNGNLAVSTGGIQEFSRFRRKSASHVDFESILPQSSALVVPRKSKLNVNYDHKQPALVGEWFNIIITVSNEDIAPISSVNVLVNLSEGEMDGSTEFCLNTAAKSELLPLNIGLPDLKVGESKSINLYIRGHKAGQRTVVFKVSYVLESDRSGTSISEDTLHVPFVKPFEINTKFSNTLFEDISKFYVDEEFVVTPIINCVSPWPIVIENTSLDFMPPVESIDESVHSQVKGLILNDKESGAEVFLAKVKRNCESPVNVGQYTIKWKRENGLSATSQLMIPGFEIEWIPLDIKLDLPAFGLLHTPLLVTYTLYNRSHQLLQLEVTVEGGDAFMFAGYKQIPISILPESFKTLDYNLYPVVAGNIVLPKIMITVPENNTEGPSLRQNQVNALLDRALPTHLFIMPQVKGSPEFPKAIQDENLLKVV